MATDAEILITKAALDARLGEMPDLSAFTVNIPRTWVNDRIVPDQGWTGGTARLTRFGPNVSIVIAGLGRTAAATGWIPLLTLPDGFWPLNDTYVMSDQGSSVRAMTVGGLIEVRNPGTAAQTFTINFGTRQGPPPEAL